MAGGSNGSQRAAPLSGSCDTVGNRNERGRQLRRPYLEKSEPTQKINIQAAKISTPASNIRLISRSSMLSP
jgi:hypothetical protein